MLNYYFRLFVKKVKTKFHDTFESKTKINSSIDTNYFIIHLFRTLLNNLKFEGNEVYVDTRINNNGKPLLLTQARTLIILTELCKTEEINFKSISLIKKLTNYIKNQRSENGIYTFNYPSWDKQDEGIATVWALLALIKSYIILKDSSLLEFINESTDIMIDKLYTNEKGLVHNKGDNFWCLNATSTLAYFCSELLNYRNDERISSVMNKSIEICVENISDVGFFPYSELRKGTYLLLYNPIVIFTLNQCLNSKYINIELKYKLTNTLTKAREYLIGQKDNKLFFVEPEVQKYSRYIVSNVTSLVALKGYISYETEVKISLNILSFLKNNNLYLCINDDYKLYNSSLYKLKDQLSIEVLYWYLTYKNL